MYGFEFLEASSVDEARRLHAGRAETRYLAGGTTLVDLMKANVEVPRVVIDITRLPLGSVDVSDDVVRIGAMVRNSDAAYHEIVSRELPALAQALLSGASGQLRNMATVGGNLLQRTRCAYFRETTYRCNKRSAGAGCDALEGFNRTHAILGGSDHCIATHASDMAVALAALDARVVVAGADGETSLALDEFYRLPGDEPGRETSLSAGDVIVAVEIPRRAFFARSTYLKLRDRASYEFALVSVAAALELDGGAITAARLALGGVATVPWRVRAAEDLLRGASADDATFVRAADVALEGAHRREHNAFKIELTKRAIVRALQMVSA